MTHPYEPPAASESRRAARTTVRPPLGETVSTTPTPATGPVAAQAVHFTDPRIVALSRAAHAATRDDDRPWAQLSFDEQHVWRTNAREWLRAAVTVGLLPRIVPSTGNALGAVPLDVRPADGRPRQGSGPRAAIYRAAASMITPEAFGWGGPDHQDAWKAAVARLHEAADDEADDQAGRDGTPDQHHAALVRVETWADQLDDAAQRAAGTMSATDPTADVIRQLLDGARHGEDPR